MAIYIFGGLSLIWALASAYLVFFRYSKKEHISGRIPVVTLYTVCLFISMWAMLLPAYFLNYKPEDGVPGTLFLSLLNTMQTFILEGSGDTYNFLTSAAGDEFPAVLRVLYSTYAAILLFLAPIMTFSNALLLAGDLLEGFKFWLRRHGSVYIMSELNSRSVILAKSIKREKKEEKSVIVFAGMARIDEDESYDQILEAKNMKAILLKKDITRIELKHLKKAELFFISDNEAENIDNAVLITKKLNEKKSTQNIKLFPFAHGRAGGYILDSPEYDNDFLKYAIKHDTFKLRRIDDIMLAVQNAVAGSETTKDMGIGRELIKHAKKVEGSDDKLISVLIVGMGDFGTEFFKMLSWYCQIEGYRLEMNLADRSDDLGSRLRRDLPELMEYGDDNNTDKHSENNYSVRCLPNVDIIKSDALAKILQDPGNDTEKELSDRLKNTTAVIVALGADTDNIESAIYLRALFDRVCPPDDTKNYSYETEKVRIYSVVYDEKNGQQDTEQSGTELINYQGGQYDIKFIGGMAARYSHNNICSYSSEIEERARKYHTGWANLTIKNVSDKVNKLEEEAKKSPEKAEELHKEAEELREKAEKKLEDAKLNYEKFEYFRRSSMARVIHFRMLEDTESDRKKEFEKHDVKCMCPHCAFFKKTEHMRWYAYMCTEGYIYGEERDDRAKRHPDMKPWLKLSPDEQDKDTPVMKIIDNDSDNNAQ